eukprot:3136422-Amphidinium_carterae.1
MACCWRFDSQLSTGMLSRSLPFLLYLPLAVPLQEAFQTVVLAFEKLSGLGNDCSNVQPRAQQKQEQPPQKKRKEPPQQHTMPKGKKAKAASTCEKKKKRRSNATAAATMQGPSSTYCSGPKTWKRVRNFPEELRRLLQLLDAGRRRQVLEEKLAGWQRRALESWMIERKRCQHTQMNAVEDGVIEDAPSNRACCLFPIAPMGCAQSGHCDRAIESLSMPAVGDLTHVFRAGDKESQCGCRSGGDTQSASRPKPPGRANKGGGVYSNVLGGRTYYHAYSVIGHVKMEVLSTKELVRAIADNIVLVAIRKRVLDMQTGDLYRERLPKAIVEVTDEHEFDLRRLRVRLWLSVRGTTLMTPQGYWEVALQ